jgi:hypothetical protein
MPKGTFVHPVYKSRREEARELALQRADQGGRERSAYVERLARAHAERWGLSLEIARRHVRQISIAANPVKNVEGDLLRLRSARATIARFG